MALPTRTLRIVFVAALLVYGTACRKPEGGGGVGPSGLGPVVDAGTITVDVGAPAGPMPTWYEPSMFVEFSPPSMTREFIADSQATHGMIELSVMFLLGESTSLADFESRLLQSTESAEALEVANAGLQVLVLVNGTPKWLSSKPTATGFVCPDEPWREYQTVAPDPNRWAEYEQLWAAIVRHFNVDLGIRTMWYQVWDEPDGPCYWTDTQANYLELWRHAVAGARSADPSVRIGGPGVAGGATASIRGDPTPVTRALIETSAQQGLEYGFVSFHIFESAPEQGKVQTDLAHQWLTTAGKGALPVVISSHNPVDAHFEDPSWPSPPSALGGWQVDNEMGAAWVLSLMKWLHATGTSGYQVMYQLDDMDLGSEFGHEWGARTTAKRNGIRKALYHAHTMVGRMDRNLVTATAPADPALYFPQLHVVASSSGNRTTVLAWRYVTMPWLMAASMMQDRGFAAPDLARLGGAEVLRRFLSGDAAASTLTADVSEQAALDAARTAYRRQRELVAQPQRVSLELKDFSSSGGYQVDRYLIDGTMSNAYYHYQANGLADAIANQSLEKVDSRHLDSLSELGPFVLNPYSATLLEITRPGP